MYQEYLLILKYKLVSKMWKVYILIDSVTNKKYVGATSKSGFSRLDKHKSNALEGRPMKLYDGMRSSGVSNFSMVIIYDNICSRTECTRIETDTIKLLLSYNEELYNTNIGCTDGCHTDEANRKRLNTRLGFKHSDKTKDKISKSRSGKLLGEDNPSSVGVILEGDTYFGTMKECHEYLRNNGCPTMSWTTFCRLVNRGPSKKYPYSIKRVNNE